MSDFKIKKIKDSKLKFNRYDSQDMLAVDRSIGNFNEWKVSFLALFWINAYLNGTDLWYGWIYVFIRVIYPILAHFFNGITAKGVAPQMFISTVPGYFVLIVYGVRIANAVF
ncbi:hypothetical protein BC833DRAFT_592512 [Globomyces pollinis-pini]|nr:hypothetical protein BC833DRAFT_592512 [Globomyces pollinis-pini]